MSQQYKVNFHEVMRGGRRKLREEEGEGEEQKLGNVGNQNCTSKEKKREESFWGQKERILDTGC